MVGRRALDLLSSLRQKPMSWTELRLAYYGEERAKMSASTSFWMQLHKMIQRGYIIKTLVGYELTKEGQEMLEASSEHPCPRCTTSIGPDRVYCVGCETDLKAAGRPV